MRKCQVCKKEQATGKDKLCNTCRALQAMEQDYDRCLEEFLEPERYNASAAEKHMTI
jgi:hypothetical protein